MKIYEINKSQHYTTVRFNKGQQPFNAVMIGVADNKTIAIWNNQDGEQINIPFQYLGIKEITLTKGGKDD